MNARPSAWKSTPGCGSGIRIRAAKLEYRTPFELLVAVVLSAQATDKSVNLATARLFRVANTPKAMVKLGEARLIPYIQTIGLFRTKAKNVVALSRQLMAEHAGNVPSDHDALTRLPGVGRKTANVVLNVAFGQPTIAVDTHIFRVANRTGLAPGRTSGRGRAQAGQVHARGIPARCASLADSALVATSVRRGCPRCWECVIVDLCRIRHKTIAPPSAPKRR